MSQTNLNQRVRKARYAVRAGVLQKIDGGWRVPSRSRPDYHIVLGKFIKTSEGAGYRVTCHYEHKSLGQWRCPGNQRYVCWHVLASLIAAAKGKSVAFFEDLDEAKRYSNLGGKLCLIKSGDGPGILYGVVR